MMPTSWRLGLLHSMWSREQLLAPRHVDRAPVLRLARSTASVDDCEAYHNFHCLMPALGFPAVMKLENRSAFSWEEEFILRLMRLRYPGRLSDLERYFGREHPQLSRLFRRATDFVFDRHKHRVMDYLFTSGLRTSRLSLVQGIGKAFCRQGGYDDFQNEMWDGHHRAHGQVYQAVIAPNGMLIDAWGPVSGRRQDAYLLRVSELNPHLAALQDPNGTQMKVYGDAAYPLLSHVRRGLKGSKPYAGAESVQPSEQQDEN